jgi:hypothetical protein
MKRLISVLRDEECEHHMKDQLETLPKTTRPRLNETTLSCPFVERTQSTVLSSPRTLAKRVCFASANQDIAIETSLVQCTYHTRPIYTASDTYHAWMTKSDYLHIRSDIQVTIKTFLESRRSRRFRNISNSATMEIADEGCCIRGLERLVQRSGYAMKQREFVQAVVIAYKEHVKKWQQNSYLSSITAMDIVATAVRIASVSRSYTDRENAIRMAEADMTI